MNGNVGTPQSAGPQSALTLPRYIKSFGVGFFAGICATFFPPLVTLLTRSQTALTSEVPVDLFLLSPLYLGLAVACSIVIGGVTALFESGRDRIRKPGEVFTTALGIPALLTGAIGTGSGVNAVTNTSEQLASVQTALQREANIRAPVDLDQILDGAFAPSSDASDSSDSGEHSQSWGIFISSAHAASITGPRVLPEVSSPPSMRRPVASVEPNAVLVFAEVGSAEEANALAFRYRKQIDAARSRSKALHMYPDIGQVRILPFEGRFLIISGGDPLPLGEASFVSKEMGWLLNAEVSVLPLEQMSNKTGMLVARNAPIQSLLDLNGRTVCVLNNETAGRLHRTLKERGIEARIDSGYKEVSHALVLFDRQYCDAVLADRGLLESLIPRLNRPEDSRIVEVEVN